LFLRVILCKKISAVKLIDLFLFKPLRQNAIS